MFKHSIKLAGNKTYDYAVEAIMILWENYFNSIPNAWSFRDTSKGAHFLFDVVMRNINFKIGFQIDKFSLNRLMNRADYKNHVYLSKYESTSDTHVNIKICTEKPDNLEYNMLVYDKAGIENPYFIQTTEKKYACEKVPKPMYITFLIFSSSVGILSGRCYNSMKEKYEFFTETINKHRNEIEERLSKPKMSLRECLDIIF